MSLAQNGSHRVMIIVGFMKIVRKHVKTKNIVVELLGMISRHLRCAMIRKDSNQMITVKKIKNTVMVMILVKCFGTAEKHAVDVVIYHPARLCLLKVSLEVDTMNGRLFVIA